MNREQAEHLLDAYVSAKSAADMHGGVYIEECATALRELILDAMTMQAQPIITLPTTQPWTGKPIVTYPPYRVTCTGTDPAFNQVTGVERNG